MPEGKWLLRVSRQRTVEFVNVEEFWDLQSSGGCQDNGTPRFNGNWVFDWGG